MTDPQRLETASVDAQVRRSRSISLIWLIPLLALAIGVWLGYKAISEQGPTITISFVNAEGLQAGKTKIKYRDVEVGVIDNISLNEDISGVVISAKMVKGAEEYLTEGTKFWVVRASVRGGSVSGLGTLLSGAYIGIDPSTEGQPTESFTGLETPPVVTLGQPGRHFLLKSDSLGSLDVGGPVYFRQIKVGQVVGYNFDESGGGIDIKVFIDAPYDRHVSQNTRFWNASGFDLQLDSEGLRIDTQSLVSIVSGGIAFDLPKGQSAGGEVEEGAIFRLHPNRQSIREQSYTIRTHWMLLFNQSVRGLSIGSPVELYGIKVGEVLGLDLEFDGINRQFQVPVLISIEPERVRLANTPNQHERSADLATALLRELIEQRGMRAQLKSGNLLTGQMIVNLDFYPDLPMSAVCYRGQVPIIPTTPGSFERLQESLINVVAKVEKIPFDELGQKLDQVLSEARNSVRQFGELANQLNDQSTPLLAEARETLAQFNSLARELETQTAPEAQATLQELQATLEELKFTIGSDSPLIFNASKTLDELTLTLESIRELMDTLDKRPQSIIFGKEADTRE